MTIRELNDRRREINCRPTTRPEEDPFFCSLGTLNCLEGHGDWEIPDAEAHPRERRGIHRQLLDRLGLRRTGSHEARHPRWEVE